MFSLNGWFIILGLFVIVGAVSYALGVARKEQVKNQSEKEERERKKKKATEENRGNRIRRALERLNQNGHFAIEGNWFQEVGYVLEVYLHGSSNRIVRSLRITINAAGGLDAIKVRRGTATQSFALDESSIDRVIGIAADFMWSQLQD